VKIPGLAGRVRIGARDASLTPVSVVVWHGRNVLGARLRSPRAPQLLYRLALELTVIGVYRIVVAVQLALAAAGPVGGRGRAAGQGVLQPPAPPHPAGMMPVFPGDCAGLLA
jgi:hypothetical protein